MVEVGRRFDRRRAGPCRVQLRQREFQRVVASGSGSISFRGTGWRGRGPAQCPGVAGLCRGRLHGSRDRLGHSIRGADRVPGRRQDFRHLQRGVRPVQEGRLRRRLRLRGRLAAPGLRRLGTAGEHVPGAQLRRHLPRPEGQAVEHRRWCELRHPARTRRQLAALQHGGAD